MLIAGVCLRWQIDWVDDQLERLHWPTFERGSREVRIFVTAVAIVGGAWTLYGVANL